MIIHTCYLLQSHLVTLHARLACSKLRSKEQTAIYCHRHTNTTMTAHICPLTNTIPGVIPIQLIHRNFVFISGLWNRRQSSERRCTEFSAAMTTMCTQIPWRVVYLNKRLHAIAIVVRLDAVPQQWIDLWTCLPRPCAPNGKMGKYKLRNKITNSGNCVRRLIRTN